MALMWFSLNENKTVKIQSSIDNYRIPDYIAIDLNRTVFDKAGRKIQALSAKKMTYFETENLAEFESPLLILESTKNNSKWRISSTDGILYHNQRLLLENNVNAVNMVANGYIDRILGENIRVNIADNIMMSDHAVSLYGDGLKISGSGLVADLNKQRIELIKHAQTIYQSQKKQPSNNETP
jgi:lipopolysaccharide export system protein LptC